MHLFVGWDHTQCGQQSKVFLVHKTLETIVKVQDFVDCQCEIINVCL